jgi:hypothetical protein
MACSPMECTYIVHLLPQRYLQLSERHQRFSLFLMLFEGIQLYRTLRMY